MRAILTGTAAALLLLSPLCRTVMADDYDCYKALNELCSERENVTESISFTLGSDEYTTDQGQNGTCTAVVFEPDSRIYIPLEALENELDISVADPADSQSISLFSGTGQDITAVAENGTIMADIGSVASALGLELEQDGDRLTVTDPYASHRLVVTGIENPELPDGCELLTLPYDTHIIGCDSRESARRICEYLNSIGANAAPDVTITLSDDEDTGTTAAEHLSWGTDYIKSDIFNERLLQKYGSAEQLESITVAVVDSGIDYTHPFLSGRVDFEKGYDFYDCDTDAMDEHSHGTHVAGIICDNTLSNVTLIPYKITDASGNTSLERLTCALICVIDSGADVVNLSLGSKDTAGEVKKVLAPLLEQLDERGVIAVTAAGNSLSDAAVYTPANIESCITVNACGSDGKFASAYSNYGDVIDICAPGSNIYSTVLNGRYGIKSGTSMACPHVSAAAAMLKTFDPNITPADAENILTDCADDAGITGFDVYYGYGILDLENLADLLMPPETDSCFFDTPSINGGMVTVRFKNEYTPENDALVTAAAYKDGIMSSCVICSVSGEAQSDDITIPINTDGCDTLKLFLLSDTEHMTPLCDALTTWLSGL